ncbi:MAG: agmatine deiminase [Eubacteriales bacterium]
MRVITGTTPRADGFSMPGEFEAHDGCIMIFPERPGSWIEGGAAAQRSFAAIADAISAGEQVFMLVSPRSAQQARRVLPRAVEILVIDSDDAWARDVGPTFVRDRAGRVRGVNWRFNAWGGSYDGLYASYERDDALALAFCRAVGYDAYDASPFVLEGGAIHTDGEGTLLVTEPCLLSPGRNPTLNRAQIEDKLRDCLGIDKVLWLPHGIWQDETNEHVDNVCAFLRPGEVVLAWTDDPADPQYEYSRGCLELLQRESDARGRRLIVHQLPIPTPPVRITERELAGFVFEPGEDTREAGERLAASYVNFYIANKAIILPQFGGECAESDRAALRVLSALCPEREVIPLPARDIILGGGNIHCITQQIPKRGL